MKFILSLLLLVALPIWSQVEITNIVHQSDTNLPVINGYSLVADQEKGFSVFLMDGKKIYGNGFDSDYNYLGTLASREISAFEDYVAGKSYGEDYHLFFKHRREASLQALTYNFTKDTVVESTVFINISGQKILQSFEHNNTVHLLTVATQEDILYVHSIDENFSIDTRKFDVSGYAFYNGAQNERPFHNLILDNFQKITGIGMNPSQERFPMTIPESTGLTKIYKKDASLTLVLDVSRIFTQILSIDIATGNISFKNIEKVSEKQKNQVAQSNSYLLGDELYQIVRRNNVLEISIKNIETGFLLNSFVLTDGDVFPYTNTATLTLKPSKKQRKEVKPSKLLRFAKYHPLGIYATKTDDATEITYGTWNKERGNNSSLNNSKTNSPMVGLMSATFGVAGGLIYLAVSSGNSIQSYGMHHLGMTTRAIGVFDENFQHLPKKGVKANIYHKIDHYNYRKEGTTPFLLFQFKGTIIYGSFYPDQNAIKLLKF